MAWFCLQVRGKENKEQEPPWDWAALDFPSQQEKWGRATGSGTAPPGANEQERVLDLLYKSVPEEVLCSDAQTETHGKEPAWALRDWRGKKVHLICLFPPGLLAYLSSLVFSHPIPTVTVTRHNSSKLIRFSASLFLNHHFQLIADRHGSEGEFVVYFPSRYRIWHFSASSLTYPLSHFVHLWASRKTIWIKNWITIPAMTFAYMLYVISTYILWTECLCSPKIHMLKPCPTTW